MCVVGRRGKNFDKMISIWRGKVQIQCYIDAIIDAMGQSLL